MLKRILPNFLKKIIAQLNGGILVLLEVEELLLSQVSPGKANLFYMGSTGGGVWKTTDAGNSWSNISDGFFGGSVGAVAVSEWDNNVIYVGNGEKTVRGNVSSGDGIWKTVDAGKTWKHMGLPNSRHIPRIRIHPKNADIVYAGVMGDLYKSSEERGVYKSIDGGETWRKSIVC